MLRGTFPSNDVCLLLDIYMPGMSGVELWRSLAASGRRLPTVLMSDGDDAQTRRAMRETQAVASLFKPFEEKALLGAIRKADEPTVRCRFPEGTSVNLEGEHDLAQPFLDFLVYLVR
jgi:FixJ family two-component response regulator